MTEAIEALKATLAKVRVDNAYLRAELVKADIYKDEIIAVRKERDRLRTQFNSMSVANSRLVRKLEKYEGKKSAKPNCNQTGPDNRADDTAGDSGCGVSH
jgi:hypothetical protein